MRFNDHSKLVPPGAHAFLSASNYHWINYELDKLKYVYEQSQAARKGIELHDFAKRAIQLRIKLPDLPLTMNMYVNDAIGYGMVPEQLLYYTENCFGTADTIGFRNNTLRIHDYKSGLHKASEKQLYVYAAYFCLEYGFKPHDIKIELRIYQNDQVFEYIAEPDFVWYIMKKAEEFDRYIKELKQWEN